MTEVHVGIKHIYDTIIRAIGRFSLILAFNLQTVEQ